jgi:hypothetical protein
MLVLSILYTNAFTDYISHHRFFDGKGNDLYSCCKRAKRCILTSYAPGVTLMCDHRVCMSCTWDVELTSTSASTIGIGLNGETSLWLSKEWYWTVARVVAKKYVRLP